MSLQTIVFILWVVASGLVVAVFLLAYFRSVASPASIPYALINSRRFKILFILISAFLVLFLVALMKAPYSTRGEVDDVVGVRARMFSFELTKDTVECGKLVEFRVSAEDVTHGFGIYNADGSLIGQVQAMPGYVNRLRVRFESPGRYNIFCLEYCGPMHHQMRSAIFVR